MRKRRTGGKRERKKRERREKEERKKRERREKEERKKRERREKETQQEEIKRLTDQYLNTIPGLSAGEKQKIIEYNADSDYLVFSARSLEPVDFGVTDYHNSLTGLVDRFSKEYGG